MTTVADPHRALGHAIAARVAMANACAEITHSAARPWASVTFSGARHCYDLVITGPDAVSAARALAAGIDQEEFEVRGHLVADIFSSHPEFVGNDALICIEALTVEAN